MTHGLNRLTPHFAAMFLGAFNDNLYKSALVILVTYSATSTADNDTAVLVALLSGLLILPFLILSPLAASLADKYERSGLIRSIKLAEIAVMSVGAWAFHIHSLPLLITVLFAMGAQSAMFGPLKYGVIPTLVGDDILRANSLIETGTFFAILLGMIAGGTFSARGDGVRIVSLLTITVAVLGWLASRYIVRMEPPMPDCQIVVDPIRGCAGLMRAIAARRDIFCPIVARSWFYFVGAVFTAQFPTYSLKIIGADEGVATLFFAVFSTGVGAGTWYCTRQLGGKVDPCLVPASAYATAAFGTLIYVLTPDAPPSGALTSVAGFILTPRGFALTAAMFFTAFAGGSYVVPLTSLVQSRSGIRLVASSIACANIVDSIFIVAASGSSAVMLAAGASVQATFLAASLMTAAVGALVRRYIVQESRS